MKWRVAFALCVVGLSACKKDVLRPDAPLVDSLEIKGTSHLSQREVKKKILTNESSWWPIWLPLLGDAQYFDPSAWQADLRRIERYYQARGYYQAKVLDSEVKEKTGHVALSVTLKEGDAAKLTALDIAGLEVLTTEHQQEVLKKLPLKTGQTFLEDDWAELKSLLLSRLRERGFAEATLEGQVVVDVARNTAAAQVSVTPGTRYKFGKTFVATDPNAQVPVKRITEQVGGAISEGDWFSESQLSEAQALVFQMGVFGAVKVTRGAPDHSTGTVPVVVDVREAPFHTLRAGGGLGIDQVRQQFRLVGEYTHRNFFGGLRRFSVQGKAGWAFLPSVFSVAARDPASKNGPVFNVRTEFEQPSFFHRSLNFETSIELASGLEPAYGYIGGTAKIGVLWRPVSTIAAQLSFNLDLYGLSSQVPLSGNAPEALFDCDAICRINYLELNVEWDRRDDRLEPHTGTYAALNLQLGGGPLSAFTFMRVTPEFRGYVSFDEDKKWVLSTRVKAGTLLSVDGNSPIISRFFSGGSSMRGFSTRRLSPLLAVPQAGEPTQANDINPARAVPAETIPIGGKGLLEAQVELRWNVVGDLVLAIFGDAGLVTADSLGPANFFPALQGLYTALGFGVRYKTPVGPVRVDIAVRLPIGPGLSVTPVAGDSRALRYPVDRGCFAGIGAGDSDVYSGSPERQCTFHLSIGEAF